MFISFLYMFRATVCPSSGETTVFMQHLVIVIHSILYTKQSSVQNNKYPVSHRCSCFSWRWAHSCPKHVEKRNKHTKKNRAPIWLYVQDRNFGFIALYEESVTPELRDCHTYRKADIKIWDIIQATIANCELPAISIQKFHVYELSRPGDSPPHKPPPPPADWVTICCHSFLRLPGTAWF